MPALTKTRRFSKQRERVFALTRFARTPATKACTRQINVSDFDACIVCIGNIEASVIVTLLCKQLNARYVMSKANNNLHKTVLQKVGADAVFPEEYVGEKSRRYADQPQYLATGQINANF